MNPKTNILTEDEFREVIQAAANTCGSQKALADSKGLSLSFINDILHGRRSISDSVARAFGRRLVRFYVVPEQEEE